MISTTTTTTTTHSCNADMQADAERSKLAQQHAKAMQELTQQLDKANADNARLSLELQRLKQE